jgi:hypothetical protein
MARKRHTNTAKPCQITPKLPFAVESCHDLLAPAQERGRAEFEGIAVAKGRRQR